MVKVENQSQCIIIQMADLLLKENLVHSTIFRKDQDQMILMEILNLQNYLENFIIEIKKKIKNFKFFCIVFE